MVPAVHAYVDHGRVTITGIDRRGTPTPGRGLVGRPPATTPPPSSPCGGSDVRALNEMVRARRKASGELGEEIRIGDKAFSVGDRVIFEQNQRVREPGSEAGAASRQDPQRHLRHRGRRHRSDAHPGEQSAVTREGDVARVGG